MSNTKYDKFNYYRALNEKISLFNEKVYMTLSGALATDRFDLAIDDDLAVFSAEGVNVFEVGIERGGLRLIGDFSGLHLNNDDREVLVSEAMKKISDEIWRLDVIDNNKSAHTKSATLDNLKKLLSSSKSKEIEK